MRPRAEAPTGPVGWHPNDKGEIVYDHDPDAWKAATLPRPVLAIDAIGAAMAARIIARGSEQTERTTRRAAN